MVFLHGSTGDVDDLIWPWSHPKVRGAVTAAGGVVVAPALRSLSRGFSAEGAGVKGLLCHCPHCSRHACPPVCHPSQHRHCRPALAHLGCRGGGCWVGTSWAGKTSRSRTWLWPEIVTNTLMVSSSVTRIQWPGLCPTRAQCWFEG